MSPKSRGRPKGRGRAKPSHAPRQITSVDRILHELRLAAPQTRLEAQEAASEWLGAAWLSRGMGERDAEAQLVSRLVEEASRGRKPTASLAVHCLATIPGEWAALLGPALTPAATTPPPPAWSDGTVATVPERPTRAQLSSDPWGSSRLYALHYDEPEQHVILVPVTTPGGVLVETILMSSSGLESGSLPNHHTLVGDIDPDDALGAVADALWQTDLYWPPNEDPDYVAWRALAHWRTAGHRAEPEWEPLADNERQALLADFAAAEGEALGLAPDLVEVLADTFVDFGDGYIFGGVLAWSPGEVEVFMLDWVHRKVLLDDEAMQALPDVLVAWVRFALRRRGLSERHVLPVVEAVDGLRDEFADASEDAGGPASQLVSRLLAAGVDLGDREAVAEAVSAYNAEQLARGLLDER